MHSNHLLNRFEIFQLPRIRMKPLIITFSIFGHNAVVGMWAQAYLLLTICKLSGPAAYVHIVFLWPLFLLTLLHEVRIGFPIKLPPVKSAILRILEGWKHFHIRQSFMCVTVLSPVVNLFSWWKLSRISRVQSGGSYISGYRRTVDFDLWQYRACDVVLQHRECTSLSSYNHYILHQSGFNQQYMRNSGRGPPKKWTGMASKLIIGVKACQTSL